MLRIDIDGVLTDTISTINKLLGTSVTEITSYNFDNLDCQKEIFNLFTNRGRDWVYYSVPNRTLIDSLLASGAHFDIITARNPDYIRETREWVEKHVKQGVEIHYSVTKHELMGDKDILVDDSPKNIARLMENSKTGVLYQNEGLNFEREIEELGIPFILKNEHLEGFFSTHT